MIYVFVSYGKMYWFNYNMFQYNIYFKHNSDDMFMSENYFNERKDDQTLKPSFFLLLYVHWLFLVGPGNTQKFNLCKQNFYEHFI